MTAPITTLIEMRLLSCDASPSGRTIAGTDSVPGVVPLSWAVAETLAKGAMAMVDRRSLFTVSSARLGQVFSQINRVKTADVPKRGPPRE
ncbi:hypothetical protein [Aurantiacibacter hainanensis]|uniref:hypothetical protein n=1 Tax=Aurantiacibacter hainanensis TaxID=3076114 RepID=UPI0030C680DF